MADEIIPSPQGLPWPEAYAALLPAIREQWKISGEIYLSQQLGGGKSGALVYIADLTSADFTGLAILKLDSAPDPEWEEKAEAERHKDAYDARPAFGPKHLPLLLHTLEHGEKVAILSTIAARGLQYSVPWADCGIQSALNAIHQVSRDLLERWNDDYIQAPGLFMPQALLQSWLGYRLDPKAGRLHQFLAETCAIPPDEPSFSFEGHWHPNPLAFAKGAVDLPDRLCLRPIKGRLHGDLHGYNVLVKSMGDAEADYFLIDLALYGDDKFLFYDHAYFELHFLLNSRKNANAVQWETMLDHLSMFHHLGHPVDVGGDDHGLMEIIHSLRREVMSWVERHESHRLGFLESQYLLARVAVGLNFANKPMSDSARKQALLYAAVNLKDYLKLNSVEWPKQGPTLHFLDDAREAGSEPPSEDGKSPAERQGGQLHPLDKPSIAVMAFENLSGDPEQEYFVDGITQEIITELSHVDWLAVISPGSTFAYKDRSEETKVIAQQLGADYLVEGSVRRAAERVRVTAHLVDTTSGHQLWAERYERSIEDIFALQEEIAEAIAGSIDWEVKYDVRDRARRKHGDVSVWDKVQKALWHLFKFTDEDTAKAKEILSDAIHLTPDYSNAHAALALAELRKVVFGDVEDPGAAKRRALEHAKRAVLADDQNSFAHAMLARAYNNLGQHELAITEAETAIGLNPSSAICYMMLAWSLMASQRLQEALPAIDVAMRLSPVGPYHHVKFFTKAVCCYLLEDYDTAETMARQALSSRALGPYGQMTLAIILVRQNRLEEAAKAVEEMRKIRPEMGRTKLRSNWDFFKGPYLDRIVDDLSKAGLPE